MKRWKFFLFPILIAAPILGAAGCGSNAASTITIAISPTTASVITNTTQTFTPFVNGSTDQTATWTVTCPTNVVAPACGTIDSNGVYTAPKTVPTVTTSGTTTITPTATITATAHADTTKTATATVTIISGISISISPITATVGTGEHFNNFAATVNNPGCSQTTDPQCLAVTWSVPVPTTAGANGTITDSGITNGVDFAAYTAPGTAPNPSTVTITATSVKDPAVTATATVTIVTATPPTLTSVSPKTVGLGSLFQDFYVTGTNFISTNNVFVNGNLISGSAPDGLPAVSVISSSVIRARIPANLLAVPPTSGLLVVTVSQQTGGQQHCSPECEIVVAPVRPAIVGPSPDSIAEGTSSGTFINIHGGFFGTNGNPSVSATFNGQIHPVNVTDARQLSVVSNASDFVTPGLYPLAIQNAADATKFAVTNIAVQPTYGASGGSTIATKATLPVGTSPSDVAINPTTGIAVVVNTGTNDVTLVNLNTLAVDTPSICAGAVGAGSTCPASGPTSVAIDYVANRALILNATTQTVAVLDLNAKSITSVTPLFSNPPSDAATHPPVAIGVNPCASFNVPQSKCQGRALVTIQTRAYGILLDLSQPTPTVVGPVTISTGANSRVAVEPHLNWAIATPGGLGSIGIVDLNRQNVNNITNISRTTNVVTVTVQSSTAANPQSPIAVQLGDTVFIQGVLDSKGAPDTSFDGFFTVTSLGPAGGQFGYSQTSGTLPDVANYATPGTVNYAAPVATLALTTTVQGIGINPETQQAVLVDPSPNGASAGVVSFFSLLDQSVTPLTLRENPPGVTGAAETGSVAAAYNPLTNVAVTVNPTLKELSVLDPVGHIRLNDTNPFPTGTNPVAVAIDPGTNLAVVVNQGDNNVSIISLGASIQPLSITETSPKQFVVDSTLIANVPLGTAPLTVIGAGFSSSSQIRLDGNTNGLITKFVSNRELTVVVPSSYLTTARRFAVDVVDSGHFSNASDFTVVQSIDLSTACPTPLPAGVAIDPTIGTAGFASVTLSGCNAMALIDLSTGLGSTRTVGTNPLGVAVLPRLQKAVVANSQSSNVSVVDEGSQSVTNITTGAGPLAVAADQDTGEAAIAASVANTATILNLASSGTSTITTGQHPVAVAFDYLTRQVAAAADASNTVGIATAPSGSLTTNLSVTAPTAVAYDPATNTFLAASGVNNSVFIYDPTTQQSIASLRVGINPTAMAYNYLTGTLITTNTGSHTITVADILGKQIRAVLALPPPPVNSSLGLSGPFQFAVDIHPLTNLAVIADTANGRVLLVPVPR
jgi:DNA-binding beta-propeller fold protein YncE